MKFKDLAVGAKFRFDYDPTFGLNWPMWIKTGKRKYRQAESIGEWEPRFEHQIGSVNAKVAEVKE